MKHFFTYLIITLYCLSSHAQQGSIDYELWSPPLSKEEVAKRIKETREQMKDNFGREAVIQRIKANKPSQIPYKLVYKEDESVYYQSNLPVGFSFVKVGKLYKNLETKKLIESDYIFNKAFLMQEELPTYNWQLVDSVREILPFRAKMAKTILPDSSEVEVWYTPDIAVQTGPAEFGGLEGLILEVYYADGKTLKFKKFSGVLPKDVKLEAPSKGEEITREKFLQQRIDTIKRINERIKKEGPIKMGY